MMLWAVAATVLTLNAAPGILAGGEAPQPVRTAVRSSGPKPPDDPATATAKAKFERWRADPVQFVKDHFDVTPDEWQIDTLRLLPTSLQIAMSACKGPGKSATLAWCIWWIMACHEDAQGYALSITKDNLRDNLWKELESWYNKSATLNLMFEVQKTRIVNREKPGTWWLSARSFKQGASDADQANTLAGLHSRWCFIVLDEAGDMQPGVVGAAKGILYVEGQRGWILVAGNPTSADGALYWIKYTDAVDSEEGDEFNWDIVHITGDPEDPKRSPRINIRIARNEIRKHGRDDPWVMVNILGLFPPTGVNQLLGPNDVTLAMKREMPKLSYSTDARVWGLDPARSEASSADEAALARRQGILERRLITWRGKDGPQLANLVAFEIEEARKIGEGPDALFVDVGGVGASASDHLLLLGYSDIVIPVDFGWSASDPKYFDKRTEMWVRMADWVKKRPSCLPNDPVLRKELQAPRYGYRRISKRTVFKLESKDEMKSRNVASPNRGDAVALTFAEPVAKKSWHDGHSADDMEHEYDALAQGETNHGSRTTSPSYPRSRGCRSGRGLSRRARTGPHAAGDSKAHRSRVRLPEPRRRRTATASPRQPQHHRSLAA